MNLLRFSLLLFITLRVFSEEVDEYEKDLGAIWGIGDSITQSNSDGDPDSSPRKELHDLLTKEGYNFSYTGHHTRNPEGLPDTEEGANHNLYHYHSGVSGVLIGETEGDSGQIRKWWQSGRLRKVKPDIILIMLGTNDIGRGYKVEDAPERLRSLLDNIYAQPSIGNPKVYLATIPPNRRQEHERVNVMIFNESISRIVSNYNAKGRSLFTVDHHKALDADFILNMTADKFHPNSEGNQTIAETWLEAIKKSFNKDAEVPHRD